MSSELRPALRPRVWTPAERREARSLFEAAERAVDDGDADAEIAAFNAFAGTTWEAYTFRNYWRSQSLDELLDSAECGAAGRVADVTEAELVAIIERAMPGRPAYEARHEAFYMSLFDANVPRSGASNLIYYPPDGADAGSWDPTPEEIVRLSLESGGRRG